MALQLSKRLIELEWKAASLLMLAMNKHGNKIYVAYSGGKDSKVILHLARKMNPNVLVVHNAHPEETCDLRRGVLIIKEPKSNFKEFLQYVDLTAQIDGTTRFEEGKTVIFDGKEINRFDIPAAYNPRGVFSLEIYYPILEWEAADVWEYIRYYSLMSEDEIANYKSSRPYKEIYL